MLAAKDNQSVREGSEVLAVSTRAYVAVRDTDELSIPMGAFVHVRERDQDGGASNSEDSGSRRDDAWAWVGWRGAEGYVPRHILANLEEPDAELRDSDGQERASAKPSSARVWPTRPRSPVKKLQLPKPLLSAQKSRNLMAAHLFTTANPGSTFNAIFLTMQRLENLPFPTFLTEQYRESDIVRSQAHVAICRGGHIVSNVLVLPAIPNAPFPTTRHWTFAAKNMPLILLQSPLFTQGTNYAENKLMIRFDADWYDAVLVVEIVHMVRALHPSGTKHCRRPVSGGWCAMNLFNNAQVRVPNGKYSLPMREKLPAAQNVASLPELHETKPVGSKSALKAAVGVVPSKWQASSAALPGSLVAPLDALPLLGVMRNSCSASTGWNTDPLIGYTRELANEVGVLAPLCARWRALRKELPKRDRKRQEILEPLLRQFVASCFSLNKAQKDPEFAIPLDQIHPGSALSSLARQMDAGGSWAPFSMREVTTWIPSSSSLAHS